MLKNPSESVALLKQALQLADKNNRGFVKEVMFHLGQARLQVGERSEAEKMLSQALQPIQETKDGAKAMTVYQRAWAIG